MFIIDDGSGSWSVQSRIPKLLPLDLASGASPLTPLQLELGTSADMEGVSLNLSGIAFAQQVGLHVYVWGSRLLHR